MKVQTWDNILSLDQGKYTDSDGSNTHVPQPLTPRIYIYTVYYSHHFLYLSGHCLKSISQTREILYFGWILLAFIPPGEQRQGSLIKAKTLVWRGLESGHCYRGFSSKAICLGECQHFYLSTHSTTTTTILLLHYTSFQSIVISLSTKIHITKLPYTTTTLAILLYINKVYESKVLYADV